MKPSFYRLFRRGRYVRVPVDVLDDEVAPERKEVERFVVAAIAFCLRHDSNFRREFWRHVCRAGDDPIEMPQIEAEGILLEPPRWADLRLISADKAYVWVVEVKVRARLESIQNPTEEEQFSKPGVGYGFLMAEFAKAEARVGPEPRMRYTILGADPPPGILKSQQDKLQKKLGIAVQSRDWDELQGVTRAGIVGDLCDLLVELQINPFFMETVQKITVASGLNGVAQAYKVLGAVCEKLKISKASRVFEPEVGDDGLGSMGFYIKSPSGNRVSVEHLNLQAVTRKGRWCLCWFGYTFDSRDVIAKEVWFYHSEEDQRDALYKKLHSTFPNIRRQEENNELHLIVKSAATEDFNWFDSVFREATVSSRV